MAMYVTTRYADPAKAQTAEEIAARPTPKLNALVF